MDASRVKRTEVEHGDEEIRLYYREGSQNPREDVPVHTDSGVVCHQCGQEYKNVCQHWALAECDYPQLSSTVKEMIVGLMMGDGTLQNRNRKTPCLTVSSISHGFLLWLDKVLGWFSTGVRLQTTAKERAKKHRGTGWNKKACKDNYHDAYRLNTVAHPWLRNFLSWYDDGQVKFPDDLSLTPTATKFWYVSDGGLDWNDFMTQPRVRFSIRTQNHRKEYFQKLFDEHGWDVEVYDNDTSVTLSSYDTSNFLGWIGPPLPQFQYKWATESIDQYQFLKRVCK